MLKPRILIMSAVLILATNLTAMAAMPITAPVKVKEKHKPIVVTGGHREFDVVLHSNPSTGYQWYLVNGAQLSDAIEPVSHKIVRGHHPKGFVGAPVLEHWTFEVQQHAMRVPEIIPLKFAYVRAWDLHAMPVATTTVLVVTRPEQ